MHSAASLPGCSAALLQNVPFAASLPCLRPVRLSMLASSLGCLHPVHHLMAWMSMTACGSPTHLCSGACTEAPSLPICTPSSLTDTSCRPPRASRASGTSNTWSGASLGWGMYHPPTPGHICRSFSCRIQDRGFEVWGFEIWGFEAQGQQGLRNVKHLVWRIAGVGHVPPPHTWAPLTFVKLGFGIGVRGLGYGALLGWGMYHPATPVRIYQSFPVRSGV